MLSEITSTDIEAQAMCHFVHALACPSVEGGGREAEILWSEKLLREFRDHAERQSCALKWVRRGFFAK